MDEDIRPGYHYALSERQRGVSDTDIRNALQSSGWGPNDINAIMSELSGAADPSPSWSQGAGSMYGNASQSYTSAEYSAGEENPQWAYAASDSTVPRKTPSGAAAKGTMMIVAGMGLFLLAVILLIISFGNGGNWARILIWMFIFGGILIKRGFDSFKKN